MQLRQKTSGVITEMQGQQFKAFIFGTNFTAVGGNAACATACTARNEGFFVENQGTLIGNTPSHAGMTYQIREFDPRRS
ncbi:MAG: hypothetical protein ACREVK_11735 [Gammaproteobacteria bacterium]